MLKVEGLFLLSNDDVYQRVSQQDGVEIAHVRLQLVVERDCSQRVVDLFPCTDRLL